MSLIAVQNTFLRRAWLVAGVVPAIALLLAAVVVSSFIDAVVACAKQAWAVFVTDDDSAVNYIVDTWKGEA